MSKDGKKQTAKPKSGEVKTPRPTKDVDLGSSCPWFLFW